MLKPQVAHHDNTAAKNQKNHLFSQPSASLLNMSSLILEANHLSDSAKEDLALRVQEGLGSSPATAVPECALSNDQCERLSSPVAVFMVSMRPFLLDVGGIPTMSHYLQVIPRVSTECFWLYPHIDIVGPEVTPNAKKASASAGLPVPPPLHPV